MGPPFFFGAIPTYRVLPYSMILGKGGIMLEGSQGHKTQHQHEKHCEEILQGEGNRKHCGGIAYVWGAVTSSSVCNIWQL